MKIQFGGAGCQRVFAKICIYFWEDSVRWWLPAVSNRSGKPSVHLEFILNSTSPSASSGIRSHHIASHPLQEPRNSDTPNTQRAGWKKWRHGATSNLEPSAHRACLIPCHRCAMSFTFATLTARLSCVLHIWSQGNWLRTSRTTGTRLLIRIAKLQLPSPATPTVLT